jgi:hypothetical protein
MTGTEVVRERKAQREEKGRRKGQRKKAYYFYKVGAVMLLW